MRPYFTLSLIITALLATPLIASPQDATSKPKKTVATLPTPAGAKRSKAPARSFGAYVQNLPLKAKPQIQSYTGKTLSRTGFNVMAVIDRPMLFDQDLEQCADWCMRFWGDYYKSTGKLNRLKLFNYNGSLKPFARSGKSYNAYLRLCMAYSNSHSLKKGATKLKKADLRPGDLIVQNDTGGIGHVSMILDVATRDGKPPLYLIGYSFMPAQQFHIERASSSHGVDGWFTLDGFYTHLSETLNLGEPVLRRFRP